VEEKGRREVSRRGVGTEGENARHPSHRSSEGEQRGDRRRHLVVSRSLTRVGLFFGASRVGEFVRMIEYSIRDRKQKILLVDVSSDDINI